MVPPTPPPPPPPMHADAQASRQRRGFMHPAQAPPSPATSLGSLNSPSQLFARRKRYSADSDHDAMSQGSGLLDSPKSERGGGWCIFPPVGGPFLTGPLAKDFKRLDNLMAQHETRPQQVENSQLLFPVVPDFVAPAISQSAYQAQAEGAATAMEPIHAEMQPMLQAQCEADTTQQQATAYAAPAWDPQYGEYPPQPPQGAYVDPSNAVSAEQSYQGYEQGAAPFYPQADQGYQERSDAYEQAPAPFFPPADQSYQEQSSTASLESSLPPLSVEPIQDLAPVALQRSAPASPSHASTTLGGVAAHRIRRVSSASSEMTDEKAQNVFDRFADGITQSMDQILARTKGGKTQAEIEFSSVIRRIRVQLKIMGRVSSGIRHEYTKLFKKMKHLEKEKRAQDLETAQLKELIRKHEEERKINDGVAEALQVPESDLRLFGKPESFVRRRMGVALATADDTDTARARAKEAAGRVKPRAA